MYLQQNRCLDAELQVYSKNKVMRVCHIISGDQWAGAEVMVYNLLKVLSNNDNLELSAILLNEGKLAEEIRKLRIPVEVADEVRLNFFQVVCKIQKIIMQLKPSIIHSHRTKENIIAYLSTKLNNYSIQLISTQHGMPEPIHDKYKLLKNFALIKYNNYIISKYFRYLVAVSEDIRNILINNIGFSSEKIYLIHNGVNIVDRNSFLKDKEAFVIGSAGRLSPIKDYPLMVEIAREVIKITDTVRFELAGDGPEKNRINELIRLYNIEKYFTLRGFIDNMEDFYNDLDLYICTSFHEGLPMSILEAMSYKLPIIAANIGGLKELIQDGDQGYLIDGRNPKNYAEKCIALYNDHDLYKAMSLSSQGKINKYYSCNSMAEKYYRMYNNEL